MKKLILALFMILILPHRPGLSSTSWPRYRGSEAWGVETWTRQSPCDDSCKAESGPTFH